MDFEVSGQVIEWRGPAPFYFLPMSQEQSDELQLYKREFSYGWGVILAHVKLGKEVARTGLIPRDGRYLVPLKDAIRKPNGVSLGDHISVVVTLGG